MTTRTRRRLSLTLLVFALAAAAGASGSASAGSQPGQPASRRWVVLVDDLHLDFRNTGRIRSAVAAVVRPLFDAGVLSAMRSSGPSSVAVVVTAGAGWGAVGDQLKRITGNALRPSDIVAAPTPRELIYRARTTRALFDAMTRDDDRPVVLLVVSNGWRTDVPQVSAEIVEMAATASRARVPIVALDPVLFDPAPPDPLVSTAALAQHRQATTASLELLAHDTGGTLWRSGDDMATVLQRLR